MQFEDGSNENCPHGVWLTLSGDPDLFERDDEGRCSLTAEVVQWVKDNAANNTEIVDIGGLAVVDFKHRADQFHFKLRFYTGTIR